MSKAARSLNKKSSISLIKACCDKKYRQSFGYIWTYHNDTDLTWYLNYVDKRTLDGKSILQLNLDNILINKFNSISEASKILNISKDRIRRIINNKIIINEYKLEYAV